MRLTPAIAAIALACPAIAQQTPIPAAAPWWHETSALASDSMEGRDTGTEAYERAARYVAAKFAAAGLKPAGDNGSFFQRVPMHQIDLDATESTLQTIVPMGQQAALVFPTQVTTVPTRDLSLKAPAIFLGYGMPAPDADLRGKIAVFFNNVPKDLTPEDRTTFAARRTRALTQAGVAAIISIDNPAAIEPFHWPAAYARSVILATAPPPNPNAPPSLRVESAIALFGDRAQLYRDLLQRGIRGDDLPTVPLQSLLLELRTRAKNISSPNILAILPGSDPTLAPEFVALSAHLDGYGYGTPVAGDNLYNGALDDAAYVATLLELARTEAALPPAQRPKRSFLFCIFTGEEKGLLGSAWFTAHPTVPISRIVADLNLDQLRPIFPLKILTMEGITDSTLGGTARAVAQRYGIELRPDLEPERNLFRRADNYNFVRVGVPIASFIFGYNRGTPEEATYRDWYARRYHKPQDDLSTPIDWQAAVTFNDFYRDLALAVANAPGRPEWTPASAFAPAKTTLNESR